MAQAVSPSQNSTPVAKPAKIRHSFWWYIKWFFITLQLVVFCAIVVVACIGKGLYDELNKVVPDIRLLMVKQKAEATRIYAADGSLLAELKGEDRKWIPIDDLKVWRNRSGVMQQEHGRLMDATLSIEDARFYKHPGMDAKRILGALVANFKSGDVEQGGSTITEQLAKNVYLSRTKTISRRLNTALLALQLERRLSKDEILEAYLNEIFYGNRAYGCEAAAQTYFNKPASQLTISEAAMLAGLPQSPSRLDPFDHFDRAKTRQRIVLHEMFENKRINYGQYLEALKDDSLEGKIADSKRRVMAERAKIDHWRAPYFVSYVRQFLEKQYGWNDEFLNKSGLKIYTTVDPKLQALAEKTLNGQVRRLGRAGLQGAMVCIDPWTGNVVAMVGGRDYYDTKHNGEWNRAVQGKRQPGSTMKPYIYAAAMEAGMTPDSVIVDSPLFVCGNRECPPGKRSKRRGGREIRNYTRSHNGAMNLRSAMGQSNNVIATKTLLKVGIQNVIQKAHLMGIQSSLVPVPTLALGTSEVSLLEHVSAYGVFATRGLRAEATPIRRVENYAGEVLVEQPSPVRGARVLSPGAANNMWQMMRYVVTSGTGKAASIPGAEVIGKTGTTSSNKDVWFMGATKDLVTGVWMGYDRPKELYGSAGGRWCAPVWRSFMIPALETWRKRNPVQKLVEDARATQQRRFLADQYKQYVKVRICNESGMLATKSCPNTRVEEFSAAGGAPTQSCDIHVRKTTAPRDLGEPSAPTQPGDLGYTPEDRAGFSDDEKPARTQQNNGDEGTNAGTLMDEDPPADEDFVPPPADNAGGDVARRSNASFRPKEPEREVVLTVCAETGQLSRDKCPVKVQQTFLASQAPRQKCGLHR